MAIKYDATAVKKAREVKKGLIETFIEKNLLGRGQYILDLPAIAQKALYNAYTSKTLRKRIKAKCLDCTGFQREEVTKCTTKVCPLWDVRPYQKEEKE